MNNPSRYLVHDGDVVELDVDSFENINKFHLFLFNDWWVFITLFETLYEILFFVLQLKIRIL